MQSMIEIFFILHLKIVVYVKYKLKVFLVLKFPTGRWSFSR